LEWQSDFPRPIVAHKRWSHGRCPDRPPPAFRLLLLTIAITIASFRVQPSLLANFSQHAWGFVFPLLAIAGLFAMAWFLRTRNERNAFLSSCAYLAPCRRGTRRRPRAGRAPALLHSRP
jgi:hypothetical protein